MADKQYNIKVGVETSDIDNAVKKTGELKKLSEKISIQYDIDGKPIDVVIDKSLNLQKQVRELTAQLRKTKEGTAEFKLLSTALGDAQDNLARSNAKSRDFLATLQLIPGPVGQIASQLNGAIGALKTFSSFSLKDIQFQLKETGNDIKDIFKNLLGLGEKVTDVSKAAANTADAAATTTNTVAEVANTAAIGANTKEQVVNSEAKITDAEATTVNTTAVTANSTQQVVNAQSIAAIIANLRAKIAVMQTSAQATTTDTTATETNTVATETNAVVTEKLTGLAKARAVATQFLTKVMVALGVAEEVAAVQAKVLASALVTTGILAIVVAVGFAISKLIEFASALGEVSDETKAATKAVADFKVKNIEVKNAILEAKEGVKSKKEALKEYNDKLGATVGYAGSLAQAEALMAANTDIVVESIRLRAMAQVLYGKSAEEAAKAITGEGMDPGFWEQSWNAIKAGGNILLMNQNNIMSYVDNLEESQKKVEKLSKAADDLEKKAIENDKKKKKGLAEPPKEGGAPTKKDDSEYQRMLADLDARIQLEINKENTSREELSKLLEKRAKMVEKHDKYTAKQSELLRQENGRKLQSALDDDTKRVEAYVSKVQDIEINAIKDEQERTEAAREKKRDDDIRALKYDEEYIKGSEEEKAKIKLDIETQYQMDLLKIRDQFFQKQLQQERDNFQRQVEYATKLKEEELVIGQQRIDDKTKFNDVYGDFFFGNKGLKKIYEKYFVDIRKQYTEEYDANNIQFNKELQQLATALKDKKITQETYSTEVKNIEDRTRQNKETYTQRLLDLDKLEMDSKRASTDLTIQIAERLGDFYDTLIQIRSADYENAQKDLDDKLKLYKKDTKEYNGVLKEKKALEENYLAQVKKMQINAALFDAAVSIARIIIDTQRAIISFSASVAPLGPAGIPIAAAYAIKSKILAALSIATIVGSGIAKIKGIEGQKGSTEGGDSGESGNGLGRGYAEGGMIRGKRHAQGGTLIEAEDGEAVMTRGAVTMFSPLLSAMNQMGGGTSFSNMNVVRPDNPIISNPAQEQAPIIVKSYVVEKDMTSSQQKQSRLKDLSTL
jgi:hypothetical protein